MSVKSFWCALSAVAVLALCGAGSASAATTWLCRPGLAHDPCTPGLKTTRVSPTGAVLGTFAPSTLRRRPVDCFYVYPTVSDQKTTLATRRIDPEERSIALYQAARYSSLCKVYAPMYRQVTLTALFAGTATTADRNAAYRDVRDAWRQYLQRYNHGRGVILIGHSQGSFVLRELVAKEIDDKPAVRRRLVSAVLLGGNVTVKAGSDVGGDFRHVRACRSDTQLGCVIAFSTFNATPPANSLFGRPPAPGLEVLCTNPAALVGGAGRIDSILPSAPFAPSTAIGKISPTIGYPTTRAKTPWIESDGAFVASCSSTGGANVLQIAPAEADAPTLHPVPDATWGLHFTDANIALGTLIHVVTRQARHYIATR
jgi:pimeloyl-ACP methyl ester carboxylesterase